LTKFDFNYSTEFYLKTLKYCKQSYWEFDQNEILNFIKKRLMTVYLIQKIIKNIIEEKLPLF
jgi:hypothetical protein